MAMDYLLCLPSLMGSSKPNRFDISMWYKSQRLKDKVSAKEVVVQLV